MRAPKWAPVALLALLAVVHIWQRSDGGIVSLLEKCCAGTGQPKWTLPGADLDVPEEEGDSADGGEESSGWRWIKQGANLDTPTYYDHPFATIGQKDPYTELPRHHVRGLPTLDRQYYYRRMAAPSPQTPGMKTVFSTNRATTDLSIMKEYGLVGHTEYEKKRKQIDATSLDPWVTRRALPRPLDPEGWTGPSKMCRDVTTETGKGLSGDGYAKLNTLRCCSFMCERSEWLALRQGQLRGGYGLENRQTFAVDTGGAGKMADGSDKYLCRSCAWYREPSWAELNMHELTKMEGHIPGPFSNVTSGNSTDAGLEEGEGEEEEAAEGEA